MKVINKSLSVLLVLAILCMTVIFVPAGAAEVFFYDDFSSDTLNNYTLVNCDSTAEMYGVATVAEGVLKMKKNETSSTTLTPAFWRTVSGSSNLIIEYMVKAGGNSSSSYTRQGLDLYFGSYASSDSAELLKVSQYGSQSTSSYATIKVTSWVDFTNNTVKTYVDGVLANEAQILSDGISNDLLNADKVISFNQYIKGRAYVDYDYIAVYEMPSQTNVEIKNSTAVALNSMDIEINAPVDIENSVFTIGDTTATAVRTGATTYTLSWDAALNVDTAYTLNSSLKVLDGSTENVSCTTSFTTTDGYSFDYIVYDNGFTADSFAQYSKYSETADSETDADVVYTISNNRLVSSSISESDSTHKTAIYKTFSTMPAQKFIIDYVAESGYKSSSNYASQGLSVYRSDKFPPKNATSATHYFDLIERQSWNKDVDGDRSFTSVVDFKNGVFTSFVDNAEQIAGTISNPQNYSGAHIYFANNFKGTDMTVDYKYIAIYEMQDTLNGFVQNKNNAEVKNIVLGFNMPVDLETLKAGVTVGGKTVANAKKLQIIDENCANYYSLELSEKLDFNTDYQVSITNVKSIDGTLTLNSNKAIKTMASGEVSVSDFTLYKRTTNSATAEVVVTNTTGEPTELVLVLAAYTKDGDIFDLGRFEIIPFDKAVSDTLSATISTQGAHVIKAFVLDSLGTLKPLTGCIEIPAVTEN